MDVAEILELFDGFRAQLDESNNVRERIRAVVTNIDNTTRQMHAALLPIHSGAAALAAQAILRAKGHVAGLQALYAELAGILKERPNQYYRYHDHWRAQSSMAAFLLVFVHWLDTGALLTHTQVEEALQLKHEEFGLDLEDYLTGLCTFSSEMPRYVVNRVTAGDYECPRQVSEFLSNLHGGFRMLNLRNDHLRKRVDGLKYDLKKVEEVLYDVTIRGLITKGRPSAPGVAPDGAVQV